MENKKEERRRHRRFDINCATEIEVGNPEIQIGVTRDFSRSGVRLMTIGSLDEGIGVQLKIVFGAFEDAEWWPARVVRIENAEDKKRLWQKEISFVFGDMLPETVETQLNTK